MDTIETSASLKAQEARVLEGIRKLEAERALYLAQHEPVPIRITFGLNDYAAELDEVRLWGHRAMVREAEEAQRVAAERTMHDRVEAQLQRIHSAPVVKAEDIRARRRELGVTQHQLAAFSSANVSTIVKIENSFNRYKPETLQLIAHGLESIREFKGAEREM